MRAAREPVMATSSDRAAPTGTVVLADVYRGRNMAGVTPGSIKKLLVLETLPKPMNYTGGMEPLTYGGTFTLERVLGTIPVEPDGSAMRHGAGAAQLVLRGLGRAGPVGQAHAELHDGDARRDGHLHRLPRTAHGNALRINCRDCRPCAVRRAPSSRSRTCPMCSTFRATCSRSSTGTASRATTRRGAKEELILAGDHGPIFSLSYYALIARDLISDGRNGMGNRPPRSIGSSASRLLQYMGGDHYDAKPTERERRIVRLWIDSGAPYPGTYAALGTGMVGGFEIVDRSIRLDRSDLEWPSVRRSVEALQRRCGICHDAQKPLPLSPSHLVGPGGWGAAFDGAPPWVDLTPDDIRRRWSRDLFYNLSHPEKSVLLLAPLAKSAGGFESCGKAVFAEHGRSRLRVDPGRPACCARQTRGDRPIRHAWLSPARGVRAVRCNATASSARTTRSTRPLDVYATDRAYWASHWYTQ